MCFNVLRHHIMPWEQGRYVLTKKNKCMSSMTKIWRHYFISAILKKYFNIKYGTLGFFFYKGHLTSNQISILRKFYAMALLKNVKLKEYRTNISVGINHIFTFLSPAKILPIFPSLSIKPAFRDVIDVDGVRNLKK